MLSHFLLCAAPPACLHAPPSTPFPTHRSILSITSTVQIESSLNMQQLKPTIDKIKAQYGDDKEAISRETSALYAKAGVDPLAGERACVQGLVAGQEGTVRVAARG
jgi:hypothetical protein